jgi:hypothetical protein
VTIIILILNCLLITWSIWIMYKCVCVCEWEWSLTETQYSWIILILTKVYIFSNLQTTRNINDCTDIKTLTVFFLENANIFCNNIVSNHRITENWHNIFVGLQVLCKNHICMRKEPMKKPIEIYYLRQVLTIASRIIYLLNSKGISHSKATKQTFWMPC